MSPPRPGTPLGTSTMTPRPNRSGPCCSERGAAAAAARHRVTDAHDHTAHFVQREKGQRGTRRNVESKSKRPRVALPRHVLLHPLPTPKSAPAPGHGVWVAPWGHRAGGAGAREVLMGLAAGCPWHGGTLGSGQVVPLVPILVPKRRRRERMRRRRRRMKYPCGSALTLEETAQSHLVDF